MHSHALLGSFIFAMLATYLAGRSAMDAVRNPAWRASIAMLPAVFTAALLALLGEPRMAMAAVSAAAVLAMTLGIGIALFTAPVRAVPGTEAVMLLPAIVMCILVGATEKLDLYAGVVLVLIAFAARFRRHANPTPAVAGPANVIAPASAASPAFAAVPPTPAPAIPASSDLASAPTARRWITLWLAIFLLLVAAAILAVTAKAVLLASQVITPESLAAIILSPLTMLPVLGFISETAQRSTTSAPAAGVAMKIALLLLCVGAPVVALAYAARQKLFEHVPVMALPIQSSAMRTDGVMLLLVSLLLAPTIVKRWPVTRIEASLLIAIYLAYIYISLPALNFGAK